MYAAAGGASLASRQKRKNQAAQNVKNKALLQQGLKDKLAASRASGLATPTKALSRQFHNLPSTYLRTPQAQARKLSGGYTAHSSRLLLPITEANQSSHHDPHHSQHGHPHFSHTHGHSSSVHGQHHPHRPHSPRPGQQHMLHSHSQHKHLTKSATASLPLVLSQFDSTPPATPTTTTCMFSTKFPPDHDDHEHHHKIASGHHLHPPQLVSPSHGPSHDGGIIVTPATPLASPGPPSAHQLERKCSFYRGRKEDAYNETFNDPTGDEAHMTVTDEYHLEFNIPNGGAMERWADADYCESEHRHMGICTCDHIEVTNSIINSLSKKKKIE